ncbi:microfibril-associated glycoprotein 4-like [Saccostrea cucullata]|uniref:microfibril-associated glycoprotein 4-like n=1 Tax=Saccostrea cuccullata TaxID=36930 RepID=UPI002ED31F16
MSNLCLVCFIVALFTVSRATDFSWRYTAKLAFDDKKSESELVRKHDAHSLSECGAMCQKDCSFFGYNSKDKKCRIHKKIFTSGMSEETGWRYYFPDFLPFDCKDLFDNGYHKSSVYDIFPYRTKSIPVKVFCEMTKMRGGWTVIQKRIDGSLSFDRNWTDYKNGFGDSQKNVWIGNDVMHQLTKENNSSLYIFITLQNGTTLYEMYNGFSVSDEAGKYQLFLAGPAMGTLGDYMLDTGSYYKLSGMSFSTPDRDNDEHLKANCAAAHNGGWWFNNCHHVFLNGQWAKADWYGPWFPTVRDGSSVGGTVMMIKRH